jgi:hypothetical protein
MSKNLASMLGDDHIEETTSSKSTKSTRGTIPALLLKARTDAHLTHLRQPDKTLATHKALAKFYEDVVDLIDGYVESSMGIDSTFSLDMVPASEVIQNPVQYFKDLYTQIETSKINIKESFIQSQIDIIQELIANTLYKLQFVSK